MSNRNPRNIQLLSQIAENNPFKKTVAAAFDVSDDLERDLEAVGLRRDLSAEGKKDKAQGYLRKALRNLRDLRQRIDEYHGKTETMRAAATLPPYDKTDFVAAMNRRELRDRSLTMSFGQRAALMSGPTRDTNFVDAILEQPAWVSGIDIYNPNDLQIYEAAKESRLRDFHGPLQDTIAARETVEQEALMPVNTTLNDVAAISELPRKDFEALAKRIETRAGEVWVTKDRKQVIEIGADGLARYRQANVDEATNGRVFTPEAYAADRAA
jgi:hypothetical protein